MTRVARLSLALIIAAVVFFLALRARFQPHKMLVISPEQWTSGQSYNCVSAGMDPVSKLQQLKCGMALHDTAPGQVSVEDVRFYRRNKKAPASHWTCQKSGELLVCRN